MSFVRSFAGVSGFSRRMFQLIAVVVCVLMPGGALAQAVNMGTVLGEIYDQQGRAVPSAKLRLTSVDRGTMLDLTADQTGHFQFSSVAPGVYRFMAAAPTFSQYVVEAVTVDADSTSRLNVQLQPAAVSAEVVVTANSETLDTQTGNLNVLLDKHLVENLPLDGNNIIGMATLLPGVTNVNAPTTFTSDTAGPSYNVSGSRNNQNLQLFDGLMWSNLFSNTGLNYPPAQMLEEVSVQLNNYKAQYGRNSGSVFNVLTKSGTNHIHGSAWEFFQNRALNAADYITGVNPKLVWNQFGATVGGPALKNRLFYFAGYQNLRTAQQVTSTAQTLSWNERGFQNDGVTPLPCVSAVFAGLSCASFASSAGTTPMNNPVDTLASTAVPALNTAFTQSGGAGTSPCVNLLNSIKAQYTKYLPNPEIPSICFNPVAVQILNKYMPLPTRNLGSSATLPSAVAIASQPRNDSQLLVRGDWKLDKHLVDARYFHSGANDATAPGVTAGTGIASYEVDTNTASANFGNIGDTWELSSSAVNVLRTGYKRYVNDAVPQDSTDLNALGGVLQLPARPSLPVISVQGRVVMGSLSSSYSHTVNENIEVHDDITFTHGRHTYQAGMEWLRLQYYRRYDTPGQINFNASEYTRLAAGDFMMGLAYQGIFGNQTYYGSVSKNLYGYFQDDWRASSRLSINLGVRYEVPFQWYQPDRQGAAFVPGFQSTVFANAPLNYAFIGDPGHTSRSLIPTDFKGLAPRVGFAYNVGGSESLIVRGGFGIVFDAVNASIVGQSEPYHYQASYNFLAGGLSKPLLGQTAVPANYNAANPAFTTPYSITFPDPHFLTPYSEAFNIGFQKSIRNHGVFEANYVGRFGRHQMVPIDLNPAIYDCSGARPLATYCPTTTTANTTASEMARSTYPNFAINGIGVVDLDSIGTSNYNALQLSYRQRTWRGISLYASYTYGRSLDQLSDGQSLSSRQAKPFDISYNYGRSDYDATHIANIGGTYDLPVLKEGNAVLHAIVNGWSLGSIWNGRTSTPFNITQSSNTALTGEPGQRPNLVPGVSPYLDPSRHRLDKVSNYFNYAAFTLPPYPGYGNVSRNSMRGPGYLMTNASIRRAFPVPGLSGDSLDLRADAFNLMNTPNLANPNSGYTSSSRGNFATVSSTVGTNGNVGTNGRRLQLSLTLRY